MDRAPGHSLHVVATTGYVADLIKNIAGGHVQVETLMGPGVDPHLYKPTPGDVRQLNAADAVFYNGLHLEGRMVELLEHLGQRKPAYAVTEPLVRQRNPRLRKVPGAQDLYDPHLWFDVALWSGCIDFVVEKLAALDPPHAAEYRHNGVAYRHALEELHRWTQERIAEIPKPRRVLVTAHDAFGYFGAAYDVAVHGLQGISTMDEADLRTVNALVELLVAGQIKAVFIETSVPPKNVQALVENSDARGHRVSLGGELYSDAMGGEGTPEGTYIGVVKYNVNTIVSALK